MTTILEFLRQRRASAAESLRGRFEHFRHLLATNNRVLELMASADEKLGGEYLFDRQYLRELDASLADAVHEVVRDLARVSDNRYPGLMTAWEEVRARVRASLAGDADARDDRLVIDLTDIGTEHADLVGEKMARLGEVRNRTELWVPAGFVVTTEACRLALDAPPVRRLIRALDHDGRDGEAQAVVELIRGTPPPPEVATAVRRALAGFERTARFAVRSSAVGEDGAHSFAGQFDTRLNVPRDEVLSSWASVVASLFCPRAMEYRRRLGLPHQSISMAVGCLEMVPARAAGVAYSADPARPDDPSLLVTAAPGLGVSVVEGRTDADTYRLSRAPLTVTRSEVAVKHEMVVAVPDGGVASAPVPAGARRVPVLSVEDATAVAGAVLRIERHMRCPQDVEWEVTPDGRLAILQARPLRIERTVERQPADTLAALRERPVLIDGRGAVACRGVGAGAVVLVGPDDRAEAFPIGAVLVARQATPGLAAFLSKASAVITDTGTTTGHLATVAREFRVPALLGVGQATAVLKPGIQVTVDANDAVVYAGLVEELLRCEVFQARPCAETPEFRALRRALADIAPLTLTDPDSPLFQPESCCTYHDIIRFAHERALDALAPLEGSRGQGRAAWVHRLDLNVPLDLVLVDLGGALGPATRAATVSSEDVASRPLRALLEGVMEPGVWATSAADMDLEGLMASATRGEAWALPGSSAVRQNVAMASADYMNLNLRVGYHANVIDAYVGSGPESSRIVFRFVGGVTDVARRTRRARVLGAILARQDFRVAQKGEMVIGRLGGVLPSIVEDRLRMLGRLVGFSRQLDILLRDDAVIDVMVERFLEGRFERLHDEPLGERSMADTIEVMVLDDEPTVCARLKDHLESAGMSVETYVDSREAVARLAERRFHVVVTDLKMSGPTGLDVLGAVKASGSPTQVIIITGYRSIEAARGAEVMGAHGFLDKPFRLEDLETMVRKAARQARRGFAHAAGGGSDGRR